MSLMLRMRRSPFSASESVPNGPGQATFGAVDVFDQLEGVQHVQDLFGVDFLAFGVENDALARQNVVQHQQLLDFLEQVQLLHFEVLHDAELVGLHVVLGLLQLAHQVVPLLLDVVDLLLQHLVSLTLMLSFRIPTNLPE